MIAFFYANTISLLFFTRLRTIAASVNNFSWSPSGESPSGECIVRMNCCVHDLRTHSFDPTVKMN